MKLAENIYNLRKEKGFSQEILAKKVNVSRQTISNWELGETSPNPEQLILLSAALEKSIDELVGNKKYEKNDNQKDNTKIDIALICAMIAGIWAFSANRFLYIEILCIMVAGAMIGFCLAAVIHNILKYLKK